MRYQVVKDETLQVLITVSMIDDAIKMLELVGKDYHIVLIEALSFKESIDMTLRELTVERDELLDRLSGLSLSYSRGMGFALFGRQIFIDGLNDLEAQVRELDVRIEALQSEKEVTHGN
jgi:hypothetical protein